LINYYFKGVIWPESCWRCC